MKISSFGKATILTLLMQNFPLDWRGVQSTAVLHVQSDRDSDPRGGWLVERCHQAPQ